MPNRTSDFGDWARAHQARVEEALARFLPSPEMAPQRLHQAMRYAVLGGGKRVRPLLAFAAGELTRADATRVEVAAACVELIHAYSLAHDDLPCMDDDVLRRGKPTCHVQYDEATALLAGDALQALAFQLLAEHRITDRAEDQLDLLRGLAQAAGSHGMAGGQAIDLAAVGQALSLPELEFMHIHKTGALIRAAVVTGARAGDRLAPSEMASLDHFAKCVGLAFQVVDDVLDAEGSTATLGKTAGKDAQDGKPTYVSVLGVDGARRFAEELRSGAGTALESFGERALRLRQLADFIVFRQF
ncbi:MAG TPA: farnesyl diphosphate synthase [Burkholderiales bacterium]